MNIFKKLFCRGKGLTPETQADDEEKKDSLELLSEETIKNCKILYNKEGGTHCWECGKGWNTILSKLSYELEAMNLTYKRYGIEIIADQVKEKFGTLRFYHSINHKIPLKYYFIPHLLEKLDGFIMSHVSFNYKKVVDIANHHDNGIQVISKEEYEKHLNDRIMNVKYVKNEDQDGKVRYYRFSNMKVFETSHREATRFKFLHKIKEFLRKNRYKLDFSDWYNEPLKSRVMTEYVDNKADDLIHKAERDCYNVCEHCGRPFDEKHNPRCETVGWVRYICEKCASKYTGNYIKGKKVYNKGVYVKEAPNYDCEDCEDDN